MVVDYYLFDGIKENFLESLENWLEGECCLIYIVVFCNDLNINSEGKELGDLIEVVLIVFSNKNN